jgi:hypothetical protein
MSLHFLTFHDGVHSRFKLATKCLMQWAYDYGIFETICVSSIRMLKDEPEFRHHLPFVFSNKRGFGYWIWKPFAIRKAMRQLKEGDTLVYMDACTKLNIEGKQRFLEYLQWVRESKYGTLVIGSPHLVKTWCKMDLVSRLHAEDCLEKEMLMAGILFLTKNQMTMHMIDVWCTLVSDYHLLDDTPSRIPNDSSFKEHRHDQSIFTLLFYKHPVFEGCRQIPDREYHFPDKRSEDLVYPIWIQSNHY